MSPPTDSKQDYRDVPKEPGEPDGVLVASIPAHCGQFVRILLSGSGICTDGTGWRWIHEPTD